MLLRMKLAVFATVLAVPGLYLGMAQAADELCWDVGIESDDGSKRGIHGCYEIGTAPTVPSVPDVPDAGDLPDPGEVPDLPDAGEVPDLPDAGEVPDLPDPGGLPDVPDVG